MAIWKEPTSPKTDSATIPQATPVSLDDTPYTPSASTPSLHRSNSPAAIKESLIAAELTIEGKVEGTGHIRMAGNFKGDVNVDGNLTIEPGAKVTGSVRARTVVIGGELEGNIDAASHVELLETGVLNGDLRAGTFVVASGSRMRGQVSFGWNDDATNIRSISSSTSKKTEALLTS
jgi:cytoskeletal protein CcmA (bactofilin family)